MIWRRWHRYDNSSLWERGTDKSYYIKSAVNSAVFLAAKSLIPVYYKAFCTVIILQYHENVQLHTEPPSIY